MIFYNNSEVMFNFVLSPSEFQVTLLLITVTSQALGSEKKKRKKFPLRTFMVSSALTF